MTFDALLGVKPAPGSEQDFRLQILEALLKTPHREIEPYIPLFKHVHESDPLFFGHLAVWYQSNGSVRDLKQLFTAFMSISDFSPEYRDAGLALMEDLPPFEVERVYRVIKGGKVKGKYREGIATTVPRSFRTAVKDYLQKREANHAHFDSVVLNARGALRTLYGSLRIKPSEYAQKILFDDEPPEGSKADVLKKLAKITDSAEQAKLIVEHKIPYRIAVSIISSMSPSVIVALVNSMSPQEVINNLASLQKRGVMDNPDLKAMIEKKLESAKTDKRVSALKTRVAVDAAGLTGDLADKVKAVGDSRIKAKGRIRKSTALLIDKSGSLQEAIDVGKQITAMIAPICENGLHVLAFDSAVFPITAKGNEMSDWEKAFHGIRAAGNTSCGSPIEYLRRKNIKVDQIIMVTDQQENAEPFMIQAIEAYAKQFGEFPNVILLNVGKASKHLEQGLKLKGVEVDTWTFTGDYYSLPSLLPMLSGGSRIDLLMEIMELELPVRARKTLVKV